IGVPGKVAEQDEAGPPDHTAGRVVGKESAVAHGGRAGERGHESAEERDESPEEDGGATAAGQEVLGVLKSTAVSVEDPCSQDPWAHLPADLVANCVADDRG